MISRYDISVISDIWSLKNKYQYFLKVEQALLKALENEGQIPHGVSASIDSVEVRTDRIEEIEKEVKHDVIAFCSSITEQMPKEFASYFHFGVTSSDIIDTALMLQMQESCSLIEQSLKRLINSLDKQIEKSSDLLCLGRSHGIYAEPMTFGQKWLGHMSEFLRRLSELQAYEFSGQLSGAVGNYSLLSPEQEKEAMESLGLRVEDVTTQVIPRDRITTLVGIFANLGAAIERFAVEIRHLHHSDVNEVCEGFSAGQKGSSTMPHKKNPISSENLTGLSRMLKSYYSLALENSILWHERDISHSSAERMYLPDMFGIAFYAIERLTQTVENLEYNRENILRKVQENPRVFSSLILHKLILKSDKSREELYKIVQSATFDNSTLAEIVQDIHRETDIRLEEIDLVHLQNHYKDQFSKVYKRVREKYSQFFT